MEKLKTTRINRSNSDHADLVNRVAGRRTSSEKAPRIKPALSTSNLSKNVPSKTCSKFTVKKPSKPPVQKQLFPVEAEAKDLAKLPTPGRKFPMEKALTMIEMGSPSKQSQQQQQHGSQSTTIATTGGLSYSTTALADGGAATRMASNTSKLVFETGFKLLLKCWREGKRKNDRLNAQLSQKDSTSIKYRNQLQTLQSLYQNECKNHEQARNEIRQLKQKVDTLKTNLLDEKRAHLDKVSSLEESILIKDKLQSQLTHVQEELATAIVSRHSLECQLKQQEESCLQLTSEKRELLKQIDNLEDNFKNFERDYEKSLTDQTKTNKVYEARLEHYQMKLDEANSQIESHETDCQLLKEWNVRLASELAQVKGAYQGTYTFRVRRFFGDLPRRPGFYVQYFLYLFVRDAPLPRRPPTDKRDLGRLIVAYPYAGVL
nr:MAP7 domain-containing protein 2-like [Aedes albopictus]